MWAAQAHVERLGGHDVAFRPGTSGDVEDIVALIERENRRPAAPERIARRLAGAPSLVVHGRDGLLSFIHCRRFSPDMVELSNMVVAARYRRCGIGRRMVQLLEPELAAAGYRSAIFVNCWMHRGSSPRVSAAARAFWLEMGYSIVFAAGSSAVFAKALGPPGSSAGESAPAWPGLG